MQIGSLVTYKKSSVDNDSIGVIVRKNTVSNKHWIVQWTNGMEYSEHEMHLEVVCEEK